ncbi:glycosyltransferase family 2 protein [Methanosphaerula palustris]|uniref:Glycosyl transferase family 2 n=1 Tax=Methanosphaerula palustris (strain ATCC BAA-1556 / DSM 19958 / E1-9c) TaxID=521011 RepID=B8GGD7_METPE|nr:glycosyltransferase family A protein [Methanosphaerula palustris]ACL16192.1 glycosyl transferase family 2 [Methanosphaerula palustris E1-9c]
MPDIPTVSVVIPLYNKEPYIARALNSVLAQTVQDFEVLVVDDGSTDGGVKVVRGMRDPRIQLVQQENCGVSAARNRGIEESRAALIAFLDADDEWLPAFIETIVRLQALYPDAGLFGTAYEVDFPGSMVPRIYRKSLGDRLLSSYFGALVQFGSMIFNSSSFAAPKDVLMDVGGFPSGVRWNEDGTLWGKIALHYPVAYSPDVCSIYHQYSANNSSGITEYLKNPFLQYISTIPPEKMMNRDDAGDLMEYSDLCRLATISYNINSGYGKRARAELLSVTSPRYTWKKYKLRAISYLPPPIMGMIRNHAKTLSYLKRKIIHT